MSSRKRLRILFLAGWYPSAKLPLRGIFIREHAKAASLYNEVTVIAYSEGSRFLKKLYEISENIEDGIKTYRIKHKELRARKLKHFIRLWAVISLFHKLYRKNNKPNIIHAHIYDAGVPAVILGRLHKISVIITEHWSGFSRRKPGKFKQRMARFSLNRASIILPVSENLIEHIQYYGIRNEFRVIPNAVNTKIFFPSLVDPSKSEPQKKILTVASLTPIKGIPHLLDALFQIKQRRQDFQLDIIGNGPNRSDYEAMVADLGLNKLVMFHGFQSKGKVAEFMRRCDFFVLPSLWETFGVVLVESMASGKPVIATDVGAVSEVVNEYTGLLINPGDKKALEKGIEHMLDNYKNYQPKEIANYARKRFSCNVVGSKLDEVYRERLLGRV
jgi:glycosyltransferase involved in cell wall biosynthesis